VLDGVATVTKKKIIMTKKPVLPVTATRPRPADGRAEKTPIGRNALFALIATSQQTGMRISLAGSFVVFREALHVFTV